MEKSSIKPVNATKKATIFAPFKRSVLFLIVAKHLLIILVAVIVTIVAVDLISKQIENTTKKIAEARRLTRSLTERSVETITLEALFNRINDNDKRIEAAIIPVDNALEFVSYLDGLAAKNSMTQVVKFGSPSDTDYGNNIRRIDFSVTLVGTSSTLSQYLSEFEHAPYFVYIRSGQLSARNQNGWSDSSTINLQGSLYAR